MSIEEKKNVKNDEWTFVCLLDNENGKIYTKKISDKCLGLNINGSDENGNPYNISWLLPSCFVKSVISEKNKGNRFISLPSDFIVEVSVYNYDTKKALSKKYVVNEFKKLINRIRRLNKSAYGTNAKKSKVAEDELPF